MYKEWNTLVSNQFKNITAQDIAILVVGSCEQHAKHLPVGTDSMIGRALAEAAAHKSQKQVYLLPVMDYGFSRHHMHFGGSITLRQETLIQLTIDIVASTINSGIKNIVLFNAHGGNHPALHVALNELSIKYEGCKIILLKYWDFMSDYMTQIRESKLGGIGHAGEMETSLMLYLYPEWVRKEAMGGYELAKGNQWHHPDMFAKNRISCYTPFEKISEEGNVGVAHYATPEKGKQIFEYVTDELSCFLNEFFENIE